MATESTYLQRDGLDYAKVTQAAGSSIKATSVTVSDTATALPATSLTNRRRLYIKNVDTMTLTTFYIGGSNVTKDTGYAVQPNEEVVIAVAGVTVYAIVATGGSGIAKVLEIA
jgi:hypothetical protein